MRCSCFLPLWNTCSLVSVHCKANNSQITFSLDASGSLGVWGSMGIQMDSMEMEIILAGQKNCPLRNCFHCVSMRHLGSVMVIQSGTCSVWQCTCHSLLYIVLCGYHHNKSSFSHTHPQHACMHEGIRSIIIIYPILTTCFVMDHGVQHLWHYLDDYITCGAAESDECQFNLQLSKLLAWWHDFLVEWNGVSMLSSLGEQTPEVTLTSDAHSLPRPES